MRNTCSFEDCGRTAHSFSLCASHAKQRNGGKDLKPIRTLAKREANGRECSVVGCGRYMHAKGFCVSHNKMRLRGEPLRKIGYARIWGERSHPHCSVDGCTGEHSGNGLCARHRNVLRLYGIDPVEYERLLSKQNGLCAICQQRCSHGKNLSVDHYHLTGEVRGLLCCECNTGLGKFRDNPALLRQAAHYLAGTDRVITSELRAYS